MGPVSFALSSQACWHDNKESSCWATDQPSGTTTARNSRNRGSNPPGDVPQSPDPTPNTPLSTTHTPLGTTQRQAIIYYEQPSGGQSGSLSALQSEYTPLYPVDPVRVLILGFHRFCHTSGALSGSPSVAGSGHTPPTRVTRPESESQAPHPPAPPWNRIRRE